jgi:flavin reductase (DIM6/NTAB) family NADH-FMN oxidoreductase RutF
VNPSSSDSRPDPAAFRSAMGCFPTGVTVVTTTTPGGGRYGTTVNAFTSVSLDPLLLLVCLRSGSRGLELVRSVGAFGVNVLAADQQALSRRFADPRRPADSSAFDGVPIVVGTTGCPVLTGTAAWFECLVEHVQEAGDHAVVVGRVVTLHHRRDAEPLVFHAGGYRELALDPLATLRADAA